jgi:hypothetical protein
MLRDQRDDHEAQEGDLNAHSHDHTHAPATAKGTHAAHAHWHRHLEDLETDAKLNGHTHPLRHPGLPWEANEEP